MKKALSRWRIVRHELDRLGIEYDLDMLTEFSITVIVKTNQKLTELIMWTYETFDDVKSSFQTRDDSRHYFGIVFKKPKGWQEEEDD